MRAVYRLIGLVCQYGPDPVEAACSKALDLDVIAVGKIDSMLVKAVVNTPTLMPIAVAAGASRFARDPAEYTNQAARTAAAGRPASTGSALASTGTGGSPCPPSDNSDQIWATPSTKAGGRWIES